MQTPESVRINEYLKQFGINLRGEPKFRVAYSEDLTENRHGTYNEFYGQVFLRTVTGVRRVRKYSYIHNKWVLEKWHPPEVSFHDDLPDSVNGTFEAVYVFEDKKGNPLPLNSRVVEIIMASLIRRRANKMLMRSEDLRYFEERDQREQAYCEDMIDTSATLSQLHFKEAALVPSSYDVQSPNLRKKNG